MMVLVIWQDSAMELLNLYNPNFLRPFIFTVLHIRKLNLCIAHFCKLTSVANMMDKISSFAGFFNSSPKNKLHWKSTFVNIQMS